MGQEENRSYLTTVAGKGQVLSSDVQSNGESGLSIFTTGIPELATLRPNVVQVSQDKTQLPSGTPTGALQTDSSMVSMLGTTIVDTFDELGDFISVSGSTMAMFVAVIVWLYVATQTVGIGGGVAGAVLSIPFILGAAYIGVFAWIYIAVLAIMSIFIFGWYFIASRT